MQTTIVTTFLLMPSKITIIFNAFNFNKFKTIIIFSQIDLFPLHLGGGGGWGGQCLPHDML